MNEEVASAVLPPITGGPAVQPVAAMSNVRAITGVTRSYEAPLTPRGSNAGGHSVGVAGSSTPLFGTEEG